MRISDVLCRKPDSVLAEAVREIARWRSSGVLEGGTLQSLLGECEEGFDLRNVEQELLILVASRWAETVV